MRFIFRQTLFFAAAVAALTQCRPNEKIDVAPPLQKHTYQQAMMGTRFFITLYADDKAQADKAATAAFQYAADVNSACSDYDVTSELMKFNIAPAHQPIQLSPMLFEIIREGIHIAQETKGAYDPTLGWHSYNWRMARKKGKLPSTEKIAQAKASSGWKKITLPINNRSATKLVSNMRLDLGGIAKGYAADGMLDILNDHGIDRASVTAGGEVRVGNPPPGEEGWNISIKTLDTKHQLSPSTITLANCAVSTSGDLHQSITINGQRYSHIVDPVTALGLTTRRSATVIGPNCTNTDALATALCVDPTLKFPKFKTIVIFEQPDGSLNYNRSDNWPDTSTR